MYAFRIALRVSQYKYLQKHNIQPIRPFDVNETNDKKV